MYLVLGRRGQLRRVRVSWRTISFVYLVQRVTYLQSVSLLDLEGLLSVRFSSSERFTAWFFLLILIRFLPFATVLFTLEDFFNATSLSASADVLLVLCNLSESVPVQISVLVSRFLM